jgi:hypothetical protein
MRVTGFEMSRVLLSIGVTAAFSLNARAGEPADSGEPTVRLTVQPMPAPKPVLKYLLLPEVGEMNSGNAAQWYLRCFAEQRNFFFNKDSVAERTRLLTVPLAELRVEKFQGYGGNALRQADWAARLDTIDWQVLQRIQADGLELTQPELGPLHVLGTALQARFRIELAGRRFDDAIRTAKTMFAFAHHLGENPTEPANRLGLAIADLTLDTLEEMLQQPGCPNLYWALTDLRCPLVDLRKGFQGSGTLMATELKTLRDDTCMTDEQIEKVVSRISGVLGYAREQAGHAPRNFRAVLAARIKDAEKIRAARTGLIEAGGAEGLVPNFPPLQVILLNAKREYELQRDERVKLLTLALWQIDALSDAERGTAGDELFADLLPSVVKLRQTQGRFEQRIALLRHVEALRMYAADHEGKLPEKLTDIAVPLPVDPFTGKAFRYEVEGAAAHIRGSYPRGEEKNPTYSTHLKVTIKK